MRTPAPRQERSSLQQSTHASLATPAVNLGNMDVDDMLSPPTAATPTLPSAVTFQLTAMLNGHLDGSDAQVRTCVTAVTHTRAKLPS